MKKFQAVYLPIGVPTFELVSAGKLFEESKKTLKELAGNCGLPEGSMICPDQMLLSMDLLQEFTEDLQPDLLIIQNITFANAAYASEIFNRFSAPVLLWTLREPAIDGGRLRLNSLTGAYSAANAYYNFRKEPLSYVFGAPSEEPVRSKITAVLKAAALKQRMHSMKMASIGHTPSGFGFGRSLDLDMMQTFGITLESIEARELIRDAKAYTDEEVRSSLEESLNVMTGLEMIPEKNRLDYARLLLSYRNYVEKNHIAALSSRCWPDFFTDFGTPVCAVLAMLNDAGVAAACEADTYGALSMYIGMQFSGMPVFFGDPVSMDEKENTITYWHCGTAACGLARTDTGAAVGVHCNRKIGPTMDFGCRPAEQVTIFRVGRQADGSFRFFLSEGQALDRPKQFTGTSVVVRMKTNAERIVMDSVRAGWEPHFTVIYGNCSAEITALADMLGIEVCRY